MDGVWRTRVGYAGGTKQSPTYEAIGDHSESVEVTFDPSVVSYDELLDRFFDSHDPTSRPFARQYASMILVRDDAQLKAARASLERYKKTSEGPVWTSIERIGSFYPAEDYHQKYYLRNTPSLMREFRAMYPADRDFIASTAAARVNGYLDGLSDSSRTFAAEIDRYGLSEAGRADLLERADEGSGYCAPVSASESADAGLSEQR